ncbi:MAG: TonB-dependent receptor [Muribaculaceae bacterium]|nr:TonB-dependent receptor [Muribaculaceae bacterium]
MKCAAHLPAYFLLALPFLSYADEKPDSLSDSMLELSEVVITGTRLPRLLKDTPVQTRLISSKDIERSDATDIQDLLTQQMPGVEFSYTMNRQTHLNLGGFGGRSVLFLIDGERLAGETTDDVDFSRIDMNNVDRIEIVRGASSALYGSNAVGGVINIITKDAKKKWGGGADFRISKHGERRYTASLSNHFAHISNTLSLSANRIGSYDVNNGSDPIGRVISTVYGHKTLNLREQLQWKPSENLKFTAHAGFYMQELPRDIDAPDRYRSYSGGLRGAWNITPGDRLEMSYTFDQYDKSQYRSLTGLDIRNYSNVQNSIRGLWIHNDALSIGMDYMHDWLHNTKLKDEDREQNNFDIFAQYDWRINEKWELVGTARYDRFSEGRISRVTPKLSARYSPNNRITLRAAYGMGFRAPTLKERYYEFDMAGIWIVEGNPKLKPETGHNLDISADYSIYNYNLTATASYNMMQNRIATGLPHSYPSDPNQLYLTYINLDNYRSLGLELSAQAAWSFGLTARLSYAFTYEKTIRDKDGNIFNNQYMPPRPHSITANINWTHRFSKHYIVDLGLNGRFLSSVTNREYKNYYDIAAGTTAIRYPAYTLWKLSMVNTLFGKFKLSVALDNLFNYRPNYYYMNTPLTDGIALIFGAGLTI